MLPHNVPPAVPVVEAADDRDAAGARGPDREAHALDAFERHRVGAELLVEVMVVAFAEEVEVSFLKHGRETVRVF